MGEILIMLVNQFVISTEMAVLNRRRNYFVWKPTAATGVTLILQPAIVDGGNQKIESVCQKYQSHS